MQQVLLNRKWVFLKKVENMPFFSQPEQFFEFVIVQIHSKSCCTNKKLHLGTIDMTKIYNWKYLLSQSFQSICTAVCPSQEALDFSSLRRNQEKMKKSHFQFRFNPIFGSRIWICKTLIIEYLTHCILNYMCNFNISDE